MATRMPLIAALVCILAVSTVNAADAVKKTEGPFTAAAFHAKGLPFQCDVEKIQPNDTKTYFDEMKKKFGDGFQKRFEAAVEAGKEGWKSATNATKTNIRENIKGNQQALTKLTAVEIKTVSDGCIRQADLGKDVALDIVDHLVKDRYSYDITVKAVRALNATEYPNFVKKVMAYCEDAKFPAFVLDAVLGTAVRHVPTLHVELQKMFKKPATGNPLNCKCTSILMAVAQRVKGDKNAPDMEGIKRLPDCQKFFLPGHRQLLIEAALLSLGTEFIDATNWATYFWIANSLPNKQCAKIKDAVITTKIDDLKKIKWDKPTCPRVCGAKGKGKARTGKKNVGKQCAKKILKTAMKPTGLTAGLIDKLGGLNGYITFGQFNKENKKKPLGSKAICDMMKSGLCNQKKVMQILREQQPTATEITDANDATKKKALAEKYSCSIATWPEDYLKTNKALFCEGDGKKAVIQANKDKTISPCLFKRYVIACKPSKSKLASLNLDKVKSLGVSAVADYALLVEKKKLVADAAKVKALLADEEGRELLDADGTLAVEAVGKLKLTLKADRDAALTSEAIMRVVSSASMKEFNLEEIKDASNMNDGQRALVLRNLEKKTALENITLADFQKQATGIAAAITPSALKKLKKIPLPILIGTLCGDPNLASSSRRQLMTKCLMKHLSDVNPAQPIKALTPGFIRSLSPMCLTDISLTECENYKPENDKDKTVLNFCQFLCNNRANKACLSAAALGDSAKTCKPFFQTNNKWTKENIVNFPAILLANLADLDAILGNADLFKAVYGDICRVQLVRPSVRELVIKNFKVHFNAADAAKWEEDQIEELQLCLPAITEDDANKLDLEKVGAVIDSVSASLPEKNSDEQKCYFNQLSETEKLKQKTCRNRFLTKIGMVMFKRDKKARKEKKDKGNKDNNKEKPDKKTENSSKPNTRRRRKRNVVATVFTCEELQDMSADQRKALSDAEIDAITDAEAVKCLGTLGGTAGWSKTQAEKLYNKIVKEKPICDVSGKTSTTSQEVVQMGSLLVAINDNDITKCLQLTEETLPKLAVAAPWSEQQAKLMYTKATTTEPKAVKLPLTLAGVNALSSLTCAAPDADIQGMTKAEFENSVNILSGLNGCPQSFYTSVVTKAKEVYGPVKDWDAATLKLLGALAAGLSSEDVKAMSGTEGVMEGLSPEAVANMPPESLNAMSAEMIGTLPQTALSSISPETMAKLDPSKKAAVESGAKGVEEKPAAKPTGNGTGNVTYNLLLVTGLMVLVNRLG